VFARDERGRRDLGEPIGDPRHEHERNVGAHARAFGELRLARRDLRLPVGEHAFALFHSFALQLDGAKLTPALRQLCLACLESLLPSRDVADQVGELRLSQVELIGAHAEDPFDRRTRISYELFAPLEAGDCLDEARNLLVELASALQEHLVEPIIWFWGGSHVSSFARRNCTVRAGRSGRAGGPVLSRRFRNGPPAREIFAKSEGPPPESHPKGVKVCAIETDNSNMDPTGARLLAARIKAGVSVGTRIELVADDSGTSGLSPGDRGVVDDISERGLVRVIWDRGIVADIDPDHTSYRSLAA
jgi:hypothetical protein